MISLAAMLERLGGADSVDLDDSVVADLIDGAHAFVENQTGRTFRDPEAGTFYLDGTGTRRLWLPEPPALVDDAYDVAVAEAAYPGGDATTYALDTDYEVRTNGREGWLMRLDGYYWREGYEYAVTYTQGYDDGAYPPDVVDLVAGLVALRVQLAGMEAVRSETIGGYSYTRFGEGDLDAIPGARATIEAWKRPVLA